MAFLIATLAVGIVSLGLIIVVQALRLQEVKRRAEAEVKNANQSVQMLVKLVDKPPETPPDQLIRAITEGVERIISGQPMVVNENVEKSKQEEQPYYPDVEFDEWLGQEGMPPAAGWWSPKKSLMNDEQSDSTN